MTEREKIEALALFRTGRRKFCPFVTNPFAECFCVDTGSHSVEAAIRLCGGNFEQCEIFQKKSLKINLAL
jgi:hypothetical protein